MDYKRHYDRLIIRAQLLSRGRTVGCYEQHHIIPRCIGGSDNHDNLVLLTPEEHYVAHQLLVKLYPEKPELAYAANMMCVNRTNNKLYGWIRRRISDNMKNNNPNKNGSVNRKRKGKYKLTLEAKNNIRSGLVANKVNVGKKNGMYRICPWDHPRATRETKTMWANANAYYDWWIKSGLDHGQNAMAKAFNEKYKMTHSNLVKRFRSGWIPEKDLIWLEFSKEYK